MARHPMREVIASASYDSQDQGDYSGDYSGDYDSDQVGGVHPALIQPLMQLLASLDSNTTVDLSSPHLRSLFSRNTWLLVLVIVLYSVLIILGLLGNLLLLIMLLSTVIAALVQLTVTLPMSLFVLIVHNWLLGRAMCYLLPMLQDLPSYVIMLSLLAISFERWRLILSKPIVKVNMKLVLPLIWLVSTLMVLPYSAFISHFYLDDLGSAWRGGQFCIVSLEADAAPYMRALFFLLFLAPVVACLGLMVRVWWSLQDLHSRLTGLGLSDRSLHQDHPSNRSSYTDSLKSNNEEELVVAGRKKRKPSLPLNNIDINKEKRTQKFLLLILISHFICILPINIVKMVTHTLTETYDNDSHFDLTYIICVWITFLPTVTLPWFYAHWVLIGSLSRRFVMAELFWPGSPNQRQKMAEQEREIFGDTVAHRHRVRQDRDEAATIFSIVKDPNQLEHGNINTTSLLGVSDFSVRSGLTAELNTSIKKCVATDKDDSDLIMSAVQYRRASIQINRQ